jgi:hypothetical protein
LQIEKSRKRKINDMPQKDIPYIDPTGNIIIPFNADGNSDIDTSFQTIIV